MFSLFNIFATSGPNIHVAPGGVITINGLTITNSVFYGWICISLICIFCIWVAKKITVMPKGGVIQYFEVALDFIMNMVEDAFDDPAIGRKFVPYFVTLFFFILLNNWLGLLPFVGEGITAGGHPLFRPFTGDLSGTLALGVVTMSIVYYNSIKYSGGFLKYLRHFFVGNPWNPLYIFIAFLEMFSDLIRVLSLSLRLFLNVTIGEILIAVFAYLGHIAAPITALPFFLLEIFVGALQAYIFVILGTQYLAIAVNAAHDHEEESLTGNSVPETMLTSANQGGAHGSV